MLGSNCRRVAAVSIMAMSKLHVNTLRREFVDRARLVVDSGEHGRDRERDESTGDSQIGPTYDAECERRRARLDVAVHGRSDRQTGVAEPEHQGLFVEPDRIRLITVLRDRDVAKIRLTM